MSLLAPDKSLQFDAAPDNQVSCSVDGWNAVLKHSRKQSGGP